MAKLYFHITNGDIKTEAELARMSASKNKKIQFSTMQYFECDEASEQRMSRRTKRAYKRKMFKRTMGAVKL